MTATKSVMRTFFLSAIRSLNKSSLKTFGKNPSSVQG